MNWLSLAAKAFPFIICAVLGAAGMRKWDQGSYERLQAEFSGYKAQVADTSLKAEEARVKQHNDDIEHSQGAINDLKSELEAVRRSSAAPPHVRLCQYASRSTVPSAPSGTPTGQPESAPTTAGSVPGMSEGITVGPDIGASLLQFAEAADIVSANERAQLNYLRLITHNGPQ